MDVLKGTLKNSPCPRRRASRLLILLANLRRKAALLDWGKKGRKECFALFSRSGFTEELKQTAANEGIYLRALKDISAISTSGSSN